MLLAVPLAAEAQQQAAKVYRIGWMIGSSIPASAHLIDAFKEGMRELGWVEGKNIEYEIRAAEGRFERFPEIVAELLRLKVDLFLAPTTVAARAAKQATSTVPIVIVVTSDAVGSGLVASLAQPGGNITGLTLMTFETQAKQLETLKEAVPKAARISILVNGPNVRIIRELEAASQLLHIKLHLLRVASPDEIESAFPHDDPSTFRCTARRVGPFVLSPANTTCPASCQGSPARHVSGGSMSTPAVSYLTGRVSSTIIAGPPSTSTRF